MIVSLKGYRIFIATPGGLDEERRAFRKVTEEYNESDATRRGVIFLPVGWEITLGGVGRPQTLINKDLRECDYLVLVLWDRWGSPTGDEHATFTSGTEEEYEVAMECLADENFPMRQVVVFFKAVDERKLSDPGEQLKKVLDFRERLEKENKLLFHTYDEVSAFESRLRSHLAKWVRDHEEDNASRDKSRDSSTTERVRTADNTQRISVNAPPATTGSNEMVEDAKKLAFEGRLTEAETAFAKAVASNSDLGAILSYGLFLSQLGRLAQAKAKYERVAELANELHEPVWKARAFNSLGNDYKTRGDIKEAQKVYTQSLEIFRELGDLEGISDVYSNLGDLFQAQEDLEKAETMYKESLRIKEQLGSQEGMADLYGNLGNVYKAQKDLDQAEAMHLRSLEIKEKLGIQEGMAGVYSNLGNLYQDRGNWDEAERMYRRSLEIVGQLKDSEGTADIYNNLGSVYQSRGDLDQAESMYQKSLGLFEDLGDPASKADVYNSLGSVFMDRKDFDSAEEAYRQSLEIFEQLRDKEGMADVYNNLADVYEARGDTEEAKVMNQKSELLLKSVNGN
jgi:tetratricopeptide (TPR) repeat protein